MSIKAKFRFQTCRGFDSMPALHPVRPADERDLIDAITQAAERGQSLQVLGGGSKAAIGAPTDARRLDMTGFCGVVDYDPPELVLTVRPGTPLSEVKAVVASANQMLAFDPFDHGAIFGVGGGAATIGGVVAAGVSGSQRLSCGAARDHLLGFRAVSGRGEAFIAGGKVVKNVTGYDLPKLAAGSWGRLFALTEITLKVLPRPQMAATYVIAGQTPEQAVKAMALAVGSRAEVAAAAYRPASRTDLSLTALRLQGFAPSVTARGAMLTAVLSGYGNVDVLAEGEADAFWQNLHTLGSLGGDRPLWRVNVPPSHGPQIVRSVQTAVADWMFDWAGGLVWLATDADHKFVRDAAASCGGHAILVRAPETVRKDVPAFQPLSAGVAALEARVRQAFDPKGVFATGRF